MKKPLLLFFSLIALLIRPPKASALTQWTEAEYLDVVQQSIKKPKIYENTESLFYTQNEPYEFTGTACKTDKFCQEEFSQNHTCEPNPQTQQNECAQQKYSLNLNFQLQTTDFNPVSESKIKSTTQNLQKSLDLLLPASQKLSLKRESALWAKHTKSFVQNRDKFPINGFPYKREITLESGTTIQAGDLYDNLPSYIKTQTKNWQTKAFKDPSIYTQALVDFDYAPKEIQETGWVQTTFTVSLFNQELPSYSYVNSYKTSRYSDIYLALLNNQIKYPKQNLDQKYQNLSQNYPLLSYLQNTDNLVYPQESSQSIGNYITSSQTTKDTSQKSKAYSTKPAQSPLITLNPPSFLSRILNVQITTKNLITPSGALLPHLMNLSTKTEVSALEPKSSLTNKTMPINTNTGLKLSEGQGGVQDLTKSYSHYLSCLDQNYASSQIDPGDWASGRRAAGMCLTSSNISSDICQQQSSCNNSPANENLTTVQSKFIDLANRWLGGAGSPRTDKYNQVIQAAKAKGVSPIFTLAIWLHESGASNYQGTCQKLGGGDPDSPYCQTLQDFGINSASITTQIDENGNIIENHFQDQLNAWLNTPDFYLDSYCQEELSSDTCTWGVFGTAFYRGSCQTNQAGIDYSTQVLEIYQQLTSNQADPQTPPCYPTNISK